jgi:hypothetical protein
MTRPTQDDSGLIAALKTSISNLNNALENLRTAGFDVDIGVNQEHSASYIYMNEAQPIRLIIAKISKNFNVNEE